MSKKEYVLGIDLGTTNSAGAIVEAGEPVILLNNEGKRTTPSIVSFKGDERKVGDPAKRQAVTNPEQTVYSIKRFIGKEFSSKSVQDEINRVPYKVEKTGSNVPSVKIGDKHYTPQEISAMILQKIKKAAEDHVGQPVTKAVITVPAYFNDSERTATIEAGKIAGLEVLRIINEPTAAALAYGLDKKDRDNKIVVFDLGGGTADVSILDIGDGVFEVISTNGDMHLGGDDFDHAIVDWILGEIKSDNDLDLKGDPMAMQRIREAAEKAKIELSSANQTDINLPYILAVDNIPVHFVKQLTRAKFEAMVEGLVNRTMKLAERALNDSKLKVNEINEVVLVGGSTRIPVIQDKIEKLFERKANKSVNPDEVVAMGAAIQGAALAGDIDEVLLLDVTPLSLGIETVGGVMTKLVEANTTIPASRKETFSTAIDNQPGVQVHVLQGERPMASDNRSLGTFHLDGIMPAPRGVPQIEVTFDIDRNGILSVSAKDKATGKENKITIEGGSQLSDADIEKMRKEAEDNAQKDKEAKETADILNQSDMMIFQTEKQIKEFDDKLTEDDKSKLVDGLSKLREAHEKKDIPVIKESMETINATWSGISSKLYESTAADNVDFSEVFNNMGKEGSE